MFKGKAKVHGKSGDRFVIRQIIFCHQTKNGSAGPWMCWSQKIPFSSLPCKASCGPWACVHDGMDGFLTSNLNHATDGRETKQCALYLEFWHVCFGGYWECCNFPVQTLTFFVSGSQRKHHLSSPITVFLKSMLFLSSFLWNTRTNAKPLNSPLVIQIHGTDFFFLKSYLVFKLSFRTHELLSKINSSPSTCPVARITALTSFLVMSLTDRLLGLSLISTVLCLIFRVTLLLLMLVMSNHISFYVFTIMWKIDFTCSLMFFTLTTGGQFLV